MVKVMNMYCIDQYFVFSHAIILILQKINQKTNRKIY